MNKQLQEFARSELKKGLSQCTPDQQLLFKKMYAKGKLDMVIDDVVDNMDVDGLDWAMDQVRKTIKKREKTVAV